MHSASPAATARSVRSVSCEPEAGGPTCMVQFGSQSWCGIDESRPRTARSWAPWVLTAATPSAQIASFRPHDASRPAIVAPRFSSKSAAASRSSALARAVGCCAAWSRRAATSLAAPPRSSSAATACASPRSSTSVATTSGSSQKTTAPHGSGTVATSVRPTSGRQTIVNGRVSPPSSQKQPSKPPPAYSRSQRASDSRMAAADKKASMSRPPTGRGAAVALR
eukprot:scaffold26302_cov112-Isochrysis_galbana.AAC.7